MRMKNGIILLRVFVCGSPNIGDLIQIILQTIQGTFQTWVVKVIFARARDFSRKQINASLTPFAAIVKNSCSDNSNKSRKTQRHSFTDV